MSAANPLRDPRDRRIPRVAGPCVLVLFGVTGDLARKKLMPAVYDLANRGLLPPGFALVGFARRDFSNQDFAQIVHDSVKEHARTPFREEVWQQLAELRDLLAARSGRPVTFGWGPRFLHSTGQYHKGGHPEGVYLQITGAHPTDVEIPDRPFTFGTLISAQAAGDANVLAERGRPVLRLQLTDVAAGVQQLLSLFQ